jgi:hypothetical protein
VLEPVPNAMDSDAFSGSVSGEMLSAADSQC